MKNWNVDFVAHNIRNPVAWSLEEEIAVAWSLDEEVTYCDYFGSTITVTGADKKIGYWISTCVEKLDNHPNRKLFFVKTID